MATLRRGGEGWPGRSLVTSPGVLMPSDLGAGGLPVNPAEIIREVAGIASAPATLAERADAVLAQLQRVVRFDAGWISLLAPDQDSHVPLARSGYDERVSGFLDSTSFLADVELVGLRRSRRPIRPRDSPVPPSKVTAWAEYLEPAGFRDGVGVGLFTPEGRYLGLLTLHTQATDRVSDAARDLIGVLATPVAAAVDPLRSLSTIAGLVRGATAGVVLTHAGTGLALPGLPDHWLLAPGSGVLAAAAVQLAAGRPHASFLAPLPGGQDADRHVRVSVLAVPRDVSFFAAAVVLVSPAGDLCGLSRRELQVLGLLVTGASNKRIAVALGITARTVADHIEHARARLAAPSRTAAAARAVQLGLFVPFSLVNRT